MMAGKTVNAEIKIYSENKVNDFLDWFGKDVFINKNKNGEILASLKVNEDALVYWALQYGDHIEVLKPADTREKIKLKLEEMLKKYN